MVERGGSVLRDEVFTGEVVSIGRDPERDVVLDSPAISGLHLVVKAGADERTFRYIDQSANGTWAGGERVNNGTFNSPLILRLADFEVTLIPVSKSGTAEEPVPSINMRSREITLPGTIIDEFAQSTDDNSAELRLIAGLARPDSLIFSDRMIVGRSSHCDITCSPPEVSRQHLAIERDGRDFKIRRLSNRNAVAVNGEKLARGGERVLSNGDLITFCGQEFVFFRPARVARLPQPDAAVRPARGGTADLAVYERASVQTDIVALDIVGFLGSETSNKFRQAMSSRLRPEARVLIDLGYLAGIDADGMQALVRCIRDAEDGGARVQLIRVTPRVADTFAASPLYAVLGEHISGNELSGVRKLNNAEEQQ